MQITINVPDFLHDPVQRAKFEKAIEGIEPGCLCSLEIQHEEFCAEKLGRGKCNCNVQFKVEKNVGL